MKGLALRVVLRPDYTSLSTALAHHLAQPRRRGTSLEHALAPEWVITPSLGTRRWLTRHVATALGADGRRTDGIVANWHHEFPGTLSKRILDHHLATEYGLDSDPWSLPQLQFHLFDWATRHSTHAATKPLRDHGGSVTLSRARHFADLFDRYHVWRPEMVLSWLEHPSAPVAYEEDVQRSIYRALREDLDLASPPERWDDAWSSLADHLHILPATERVSVFGLTSFPGGHRYIESLTRLDAYVDVTVYAVPGFAHCASAVDSRAAFRTSLLQLWGGVAVTTRPLFDELREVGDCDETLDTATVPTTLLGSLQHVLVADDVVPVTTPDATVVEHLCHGEMRQVEVLRDAIRHDLAAHPEWDEADLLVVCPDLATYAPLIRTAFGPSRFDATDEPQPSLAYRIVEPSLHVDGHYVAAVRHLLALVRSRFTRTEVLQLLNQPAVRRRRRLDDEDVALLDTWTRDVAIRWGLDVAHRARFDVAGAGSFNTWRAGLDRLQFGVMVENRDVRTVDAVLPLEVSASHFALVASLAQLIAVLNDAVHATWHRRSLGEWLDWFDQLTDAVLAPGPDEMNDVRGLRQALEPLRTAARSTSTLLSFNDVSELLERALDDLGYLGALFTGGITITSPDTVRHIPFTATYVLGFDEEAFVGSSWEHDDLRRLDLRAGDISPSDDARSRLAELILATRERLTIMRTSRDLGTNVPVEPSVVLSELHDQAAAITGDGHTAPWLPVITIQHPRHGFHASNFDPDASAFASLRALGVMSGPWSFSRLDVRLDTSADPRDTTHRLATVELPDPQRTAVTLSELDSFLKNPPRSFVRDTLGIKLSDWDDVASDDLEATLGPLTRSSTIRRLVNYVTTHQRPFDQSLRALADSGDIPPLSLVPVDDLRSVITGLADAFNAATHGATLTPWRVELDVTGTTVSAQLHPYVRDGGLHLVELLTSKVRLDRLIGPWLRAVALRASAPASIPVTLDLIFQPADPNATDAVVSLAVEASDAPVSALSTLTSVVTYFHQNLRAPIPYEPRWQPKNWASAEVTDDLWHQEAFSVVTKDQFLGDPYWHLLFSHLSAGELMDRYNDPVLGVRKVYLTMRNLFQSVADVATVATRYGEKQ